MKTVGGELSESCSVGSPPAAAAVGASHAMHVISEKLLFLPALSCFFENPLFDTSVLHRLHVYMPVSSAGAGSAIGLCLDDSTRSRTPAMYACVTVNVMSFAQSTVAQCTTT